MKESVAIAKEANSKKESSHTRSDNSTLRLRNEPERKLGSLRGVIGNITRDGGTPSVESISTELSGMHLTAQRAPALLALQRTQGNRYVQRVVTGIQAKLKVGQPGDIYEQEADKVADAVMRMPEPEVQRQPEEEEKEELIQTKPLAEKITPLVQKQIEEEEKEKEEVLRTKEVPGQTSEVTPTLESSINSLKGGSQPLSESERSFFEPRFGYDFSQVRVHTGVKAAESAQEVNSRAYTVGPDIVFGAGQYAPGTVKGRKLLAHELTHVVQQRRIGEQFQRDELPRIPTPREAAESLLARQRLIGILARYLPATQLTTGFQQALQSVMSESDIRRITFPIDRQEDFLEQVDLFRIRLHMGPETLGERIEWIITRPPVERAAPAVPSILPEWLSRYRDGRAGFFVGLSFGPEAGEETLAAQLTAHFRNRGLPISSDLLTQLMTNYETGVQQLESLLRPLLPTEIPTGGAARLIAEHLLNASLEASVRAERPTQVERAEEAAEQIQAILPGEEASRDLGLLSDLVNDLGTGITITIRWR